MIKEVLFYLIVLFYLQGCGSSRQSTAVSYVSVNLNMSSSHNASKFLLSADHQLNPTNPLFEHFFTKSNAALTDCTTQKLNGGVGVFFTPASSVITPLSAISFFFKNECDLHAVSIPAGQYFVHGLGFTSAQGGVNPYTNIGGTDLNIVDGVPFCAQGYTLNGTTSSTGFISLYNSTFSSNTANTSTTIQFYLRNEACSQMSLQVAPSDAAISASFSSVTPKFVFARKEDQTSTPDITTLYKSGSTQVNTGFIESTSLSDLNFYIFQPTYFVQCPSYQTVANAQLPPLTGDQDIHDFFSFGSALSNWEITQECNALATQMAPKMQSLAVYLVNQSVYQSMYGANQINTLPALDSTNSIKLSSCVQPISVSMENFASGDLSRWELLNAKSPPVLLPYGNEMNAAVSDSIFVNLNMLILGFSDTDCQTPSNIYFVPANLTNAFSSVTTNPFSIQSWYNTGNAFSSSFFLPILARKITLSSMDNSIFFSSVLNSGAASATSFYLRNIKPILLYLR